VTELEIVEQEYTAVFSKLSSPIFTASSKGGRQRNDNNDILQSLLFIEKVLLVRQKLKNRADHSFSKKFDLLTL